jgi:hypothetical protein
MHTPNAKGLVPTGSTATTMLVTDHRHGADAEVRDKDFAAVRGDGHPSGALPTVMGKPTAVLVAVSITDTVLSLPLLI